MLTEKKKMYRLVLSVLLIIAVAIAQEEESGTAETCSGSTTNVMGGGASTNLLDPIDESLIGVPPGSQKCKVDQDGNCVDTSCIDKHPSCNTWSSAGECDSNSKYMLNFCKKSCNVCDFDGNLTELILLKQKLALVGGDETLLETPYGMTQIVQVSDEHAAVLPAVIKEMEDYMETVIFKDPAFEKLRHTCKNRNANCVYWKAIGECEVNPVFMEKTCAPACKTCHVLDYNTKCPVDKTQPVALQPSDLNKLFERLATDEFYRSKYDINVYSKPDPTPEDGEDVKDGPWVLTLDNFMTDEECDRLVQLGHDLGYQRSADTGKRNFDGTYDKAINNGRTSTNAFCQLQCETDPVTVAVTERIENITGVTQINYEYLQLLRYETGQFYNAHHDYAEYHKERQFGPRIMTVFLYLNDPEEGGATEFPELGFSVQPKKGKALVWPSVLNKFPEEMDWRTRHGALPVTKGIKYAANAWIHQGNFKDTYKKGCI